MIRCQCICEMMHEFRQNVLSGTNQKLNKTKVAPSMQQRHDRILRTFINNIVYETRQTYPSLCAPVQSPTLMCVCKFSRFTEHAGCARDQINKKEGFIVPPPATTSLQQQTIKEVI